MPDYSQHSLHELYDVQQHINKEKHPAIYARLLQEIENREQQQSNLSSQKPSRFVSATVAFTLACLGLYWGGWALFMIIAHLTPPEPGTRNDFEPWFGVLIGCVWLFVALLCFIPAIIYLKRGKN